MTPLTHQSYYWNLQKDEEAAGFFFGDGTRLQAFSQLNKTSEKLY
jgi:hypothetical protein